MCCSGVQLADFGLSRILTSDIYSHVITRTYGTVAYMPPELLKTGHLSRPADVWSFSLLMWSLFTGEVGASTVPPSSFYRGPKSVLQT